MSHLSCSTPYRAGIRHQNHTLRFCVVTFILLVGIVGEAVSSQRFLDRQLVNALIVKDEARARELLEDGANPEALLGHTIEDSAMCTAINSRGTGLLELLLEFGASPNNSVKTVWPWVATPLSCAVFVKNEEAFNLLLDRGADPGLSLCTDCWRGGSIAHYVIEEDAYPYILTLIGRTEIGSDQLDVIVERLEETDYTRHHPWDDEREELIAWVRDQGVDFSPMEPSLMPFWDPDYVMCLHTDLDSQEGRQQGSICD